MKVRNIKSAAVVIDGSILIPPRQTVTLPDGHKGALALIEAGWLEAETEPAPEKADEKADEVKTESKRGRKAA